MSEKGGSGRGGVQGPITDLEGSQQLDDVLVMDTVMDSDLPEDLQEIIIVNIGKAISQVRVCVRVCQSMSECEYHF